MIPRPVLSLERVAVRSMPGILIMAVALGALAAPLPAAERDLSHPCAGHDDAAVRLACYDAAFPRPPAPAEAAQPAPAPAATRPGAPTPAGPVVATPVPPPAAEQLPAAAAADEIETFGLSGVQLDARDPARRERRLEQIEATVTEISFRGSGERVIRLDNGQVWLQTEVTVRGPLSLGDTVVIRRGALSSFRLVTPGRVSLRVRRIE
jgi:hypothetical protein